MSADVISAVRLDQHDHAKKADGSDVVRASLAKDRDLATLVVDPSERQYKIATYAFASDFV